MSPQSWVQTILGGVLKSEILDPKEGSPLYGSRRRIVDCVCRCGERLAMVTDTREGPWLTAWYPTIMVRQSNQGEPFWTIQAGEAPADTEEVVLHCFEHGHGVVAGGVIRKAIEAYRSRGRCVRVVVDTSPADH